jgi:hypothetical protein
MCEQCVAQCLSLGEVVSGIYLVRATRDGMFMKADQWGLVICNDPFMTWTFTPIKFPPDDEDLPIECEDYRNDFLDNCCCFPSEGYKLGQGCVAAGWNPDEQNMDFWLMERIGEYVESEHCQGILNAYKERIQDGTDS